MNRFRIWIDQDSVLYNLHDPWLRQHNEEYPDHKLTKEDHIGWDASKACKDNNCEADIYKYFNYPETWIEGSIVKDANHIVYDWYKDKIADLGIISTAANAMSIPYKIEWLEHNFPYIKDILISHKSHLKHLLYGDILIDDGIHNLEQWQGIGILYTQPWNKNENRLRADNWQEVDRLVKKAIQLLDMGYKHKSVESGLHIIQKLGYSKG